MTRSPRRAGGWAAVALLAGGAALIGLLAVASPGYAAAPVPVTVGISDPAEFTPGAQHTVAFTVTNGTPGVGENTSLTATITIATSAGSASPDFTFTAGAGCFNAGSAGNTCRFRFPENGAGMVRSLSFVVTATGTVTDVPAGGATTFAGSAISVSSTTAGSTPVSGGFSVTLDGPAAGPTGPSAPTTIAGVIDSAATHQPLGGARVTLRDAAARAYPTTTDSTGRFSFTVTAASPVTGPFVITVSMPGYQQFTSAPQAFTPGTDINLTEVVQPLAAAGGSARASAPASQSTATGGALPPPATTGPAGTNPAGTLDGQIGAGLGGTRAGSTSGPLTYVLTIGVVLVGAAAAVLVSLLVRRRREGDAQEPVTAPPAGDDTTHLPEIADWPPPATRAARTLPGARHVAPARAWQVAGVRTLSSGGGGGDRTAAVTRVDDDLPGPDPAHGFRPTRPGTHPAAQGSPSTRVRIYGVDGYHGEPLDRNEGDRM